MFQMECKENIRLQIKIISQYATQALCDIFSFFHDQEEMQNATR